jgi:hypothetical protein
MAIFTFMEVMDTRNIPGKFRRSLLREISPETLADNPRHVHHIRIFVTN